MQVSRWLRVFGAAKKRSALLLFTLARGPIFIIASTRHILYREYTYLNWCISAAIFTYFSPKNRGATPRNLLGLRPRNPECSLPVRPDVTPSRWPHDLGGNCTSELNF